MSERYELGTSDAFKRSGEIGLLMLRGAFYGAVLFVGIGVFIWILVLIGNLLPPESKEAADPTPWSMIAPEAAPLPLVHGRDAA